METIALEKCSQEPVKPWLAPDLLPLKPAGSHYGYQIGKQFYPCTREELIAACAPEARKDVELVCHPDSDRLVPALEVPFLRETCLKRMRAGLNFWLAGGIIGLCSVSMAAFTGKSGSNDDFWGSFLFLAALPLCEWACGIWALRSNGAAALQSTAFEGTRFGLWIGQQRKVYTWAILAVCAGVSIVGFVCGLDHAVAKAGLVKEQENGFAVWRLLSGPLLHANLQHLVFNLVALASLGSITEVLAGRGVTAAVVVIATLSGSLFSRSFSPGTPSVGISGGVMGLLGFILALAQCRRTLVPAALPKDLIRGLLMVAFMGLVAWNFIDNAAHLGGGLAGAALGLWIARQPLNGLPLPRSLCWELAGALAITLVVTAGAWAIFAIVR